MMKIKIFLPLCVLFVLAAGLMGCSGDDDNGIVRESVLTGMTKGRFLIPMKKNDDIIKCET